MLLVPMGITQPWAISQSPFQLDGRVHDVKFSVQQIFYLAQIISLSESVISSIRTWQDNACVSEPMLQTWTS